MILEYTFTLNDWLNTHHQPMMIINQHLKIVAVNRAFEKHFGIKTADLVGKPCCICQKNCHHQRFFENNEDYSGHIQNSFLTQYYQKNINQYLFQSSAVRNTAGELLIAETIKIPQTIDRPAVEQRLIGISPFMVKLREKLQQVAKSNVPVLLNGETGTGKEVAATFIHEHSKQANGQLIIVDCTLLTESLCESELFGHEKGAFTNAMSTKQGLFEMAHKGTLFLDEIGELPLSQQPKLLRALETGHFRRIGGTKTLSSNVRVVCATHRHLGEMVKAGKFREDLYYRLSVMAIEIPPLRERKQDIPLLVEYMLRLENHYQSITQHAMQKIILHSWPGNIRELKNCLQLAVVLSNQTQITTEHIQILRRKSRTVSTVPAEASHQQSIPVEKMQTQTEMINQLLRKYHGNRKHVASEIGISERTLYRKLKQLGLH